MEFANELQGATQIGCMLSSRILLGNVQKTAVESCRRFFVKYGFILSS